MIRLVDSRGRPASPAEICGGHEDYIVEGNGTGGFFDYDNDEKWMCDRQRCDAGEHRTRRRHDGRALPDDGRDSLHVRREADGRTGWGWGRARATTTTASRMLSNAFGPNLIVAQRERAFTIHRRESAIP